MQPEQKKCANPTKANLWVDPTPSALPGRNIEKEHKRESTGKPHTSTDFTSLFCLARQPDPAPHALGVWTHDPPNRVSAGGVVVGHHGRRQSLPGVPPPVLSPAHDVLHVLHLRRRCVGTVTFQRAGRTEQRRVAAHKPVREVWLGGGGTPNEPITVTARAPRRLAVWRHWQPANSLSQPCRCACSSCCGHLWGTQHLWV